MKHTVQTSGEPEVSEKNPAIHARPNDLDSRKRVFLLCFLRLPTYHVFLIIYVPQDGEDHAHPLRRTLGRGKKGDAMKAEFTAIIEAAPEGGYWAICPEIPGANGQGETIEETKRSLIQAIELILEDRRADILRGLPDDAIQEKVLVG
jgi:predicted RNase H-like HicB family nuclease